MGAAVQEGVRATTLPSGTRIVTEAMPGVRSVAVGFWIGCGSRDERGPVAGASHFLEHLLFKGTQRRSAKEIAETVDAVGGDLNAFTSKEYTCFYARCIDRDLPLAVDVLGDMITSARLRSADVDAERDVVLEEISMHLDTPDDLVHSVFSAAHFGTHPLGREVLGSEASITAMRRDQINRYYRRQYVPSNLVVAAAGSLDHDRVVQLVSEALADARAGDGRSRRTPPEAAGEPRTALRHKPTEQTHLVLGGPGLRRADERRWAAAVLNQALGGGMASRLFQEVRERRGLVYTVYTYHGMHADTGTFAVYAGTAPHKVDEVLHTVRTEFAKALDAGLTEEELDRAKGSVAGSMILGLEDTGSRMNRLGKSVITGTPLLTLDEMIAAVGAVSLYDVAAVGQLLLGGPFTLAMVGPVEGSDEEALAAYASPTAA
ncbi:MAG TPA: pitrilysin family protein [Egibacteraceae bacterium]|jgi:predicted Zn-dependent peptidase|nr:pitrilysin family protein [Egibacteraceae bacterium]